MKIFRTDVFEGTSKRLLNLVVGLDEVPVSQNSIELATYRVWQYDEACDAENDEDGTEVGDEAELDVQDIIFDDLQTDNGWPPNQGEGYNVKVTIPAARFPTPGFYRVETMLAPSQILNEDPIYLVWLIEVLPIASN